MNTSPTKVIKYAFVIVMIGLAFMAVLTMTNGKIGLSAEALAIATQKQTEVQAEAQIQFWTTEKSNATKEILRLNGVLAKQAEAQGKQTATLR